MRQILQNLRTGDTEVADIPAPCVGTGELLIWTTHTLISPGTERMLVEFGRASLLDKARQQPDKVRQALEKVRTELESIPGVESTHDLHVWTVTSGMVAMSVHAIVRDSGNHQSVLEKAHDLLAGMGIQHSTIQLECQEMFERELHLHP